jgi:hypothetical protein
MLLRYSSLRGHSPYYDLGIEDLFMVEFSMVTILSLRHTEKYIKLHDMNTTEAAV